MTAGWRNRVSLGLVLCLLAGCSKANSGASNLTAEETGGLKEQRVELARAAVKSLTAEHNAGVTPIFPVLWAMNELYEAEIDLAETEEDKATAATNHREALTGLHGTVKAGFVAGMRPASDLQVVELELAKAKLNR